MEALNFEGVYKCTCYRDGKILWTDIIGNIVTVEGRNAILANALTGSAYTAVSFMGLIAYGGSDPSATDTMLTHGFIEAGATAPTYTERQQITWDTPVNGSISTATAAQFSITTTGGTVRGCFIAFDGAVNTNEDTDGSLLSAGYFTGGDKILAANDLLQVTYTLTAVGA